MGAWGRSRVSRAGRVGHSTQGTVLTSLSRYPTKKTERAVEYCVLDKCRSADIPATEEEEGRWASGQRQT